MIDIAAFQRSVVQLVALASGIANSQIQLIRDGELPELSGCYCSIQLMNDRTIGAPSPTYKASGTIDVLDEEINVATQFTLSVNFFRNGAMQFAHNMRPAGFRSAVQQHLYENDLGWLRFGPINNLTGFFSGQYEERAQADLLLLADGLDTGQVNQALSVDVDITQPLE